MTYPIGDLLTRIRNGQMARKEMVAVPYSRLKKDMIHVLTEKGFIEGYKEEKDGKFKQIVIELKVDRELALKRISKPGQRIYTKKGEVGKVLNGYGVALVSTSKGVMAGRDARKQGLGGEVLCEVY